MERVYDSISGRSGFNTAGWLGSYNKWHSDHEGNLCECPRQGIVRVIFAVVGDSSNGTESSAVCNRVIKDGINKARSLTKGEKARRRKK